MFVSALVIILMTIFTLQILTMQIIITFLEFTQKFVLRTNVISNAN